MPYLLTSESYLLKYCSPQSTFYSSSTPALISLESNFSSCTQPSINGDAEDFRSFSGF